MQPHLGPGPRRVPWSLQIVNFFNGAAQIGWAVFGFGMIFAWAFAFNADLSFLNFRGLHATKRGQVVRVETTNASEGKVRIRANHYTYSVGGAHLEGVSYTTGESVSPGDSVTIEYDEANPERSRIAGMRRAMFSPFVLFVSIFPLIGLLLLAAATLWGLKRNQLLRDGLIANGTLISKTPTNMHVNRRPVYELRFEFTARDGRRHEATARTSITAKLEDEAQEPLLYDPADPARACLLDEAPARPEIEPNGDLRGRPASAMRSLILPLLVIGGHGTVLLFKMGFLNS